MSNPEKMPLKRRILLGVFSGLVYASLMALFDHFSDLPFNPIKFVVSVVLFGAFMAIAHRWIIPKSKK